MKSAVLPVKHDIAIWHVIWQHQIECSVNWHVNSFFLPFDHGLETENLAGSKKVAHILKVWSLLSTKKSHFVKIGGKLVGDESISRGTFRIKTNTKF